tara:strand:+ start:156 stop:1880 length:1725 start_codon:yes stop_codon:yes gene_type:complete
MPSTRPTVDPVLDILEEMGYDFDELDGDGYKRSIKEAIIKLTNKDPKDSRIGTLIEELKKVKKSRKTEVKEKKTTIKASKFLPGRGKFSADDIKSNNEAEMGQDVGKKDKIIAFLNGDVKDNLDDVRDDLKQIEGLISDGNKSADEQYEEMRQGILAGKKKKREEDLEKKDKKPGDNKMLDMITKPAGSFFDKIIRFITFTFLGSVVNRLISILNDPAQLLDPIKKFFNAIIGMVNVVIKALWDITGAPINFIIGGINDGAKFIIDSINSVSSKLNLPEIPQFSIPLVPGPPTIPDIPLSKTAQEQNEEAVVGMAGGGVVPGPMGPMGIPGMDGMDGLSGLPGLPDIGGTIKKPTLMMPDGIELPGLGGGGGGTNAITDKAQTKSVGSRTKDIGNLLARPFRTKADRLAADPTSQFASGFGGGGFVPYSNFTLGTGHNVINTAPENIMGYNKGGKVPGSGDKDTVPAMLTPGEFVMSKGAVDKIGVDNLMDMNKEGGGTNKPTMMKFAGGGSVPDIGTPNKKGGPVIIMSGGGGSQAPNIQAPSQSPEGVPKFSSTDPNNMNKVVIKSLYNMVG